MFNDLSYLMVCHLMHRKTGLEFIKVLHGGTGVPRRAKWGYLSNLFVVVLKNLFNSVGSASTQNLFGCRMRFFTSHTFLGRLEESAAQ